MTPAELYTIEYNFFDYLLNVDNVAVLVPAPFGYHLVYGCLYCSLILAFAAKSTLEETN